MTNTATPAPATAHDSTSPALPVIDLSTIHDHAPNSTEAEAFRRELLAAAKDVGFFYLVGHDVERARIDELLDVARAFFALPEADKRAIENLNSPHFRGWTRLGGELTQGATDWREQIDIGVERATAPATADEPWNVLDGPNQWPAALPELRSAVLAWQHDLDRVAGELLSQLALALGAPADTFDAAYEHPSSLIKIIRYPGTDETTQGVGAHKDSGVLTLLLCEPGSAGLQVERDGEWVDVPPLDGAFVVNIGELLEVATDGLLVATNHRVLAPAPGTTRISIPYFHNPSLGTQIPRLNLPPELAAQAPGATQDAANVLHDTYGANALKSRLRAHPDVAARHHPDLVARAS